MHLFIPPTFFEGCGEYPHEGASISDLLAGLVMIVSIGALTLTLCYALTMLLVGIPLETGFGPPTTRLITLSM
jgi:hypothetical protein